jgi:hypothetical protein
VRLHADQDHLAADGLRDGGEERLVTGAKATFSIRSYVFP